MTTIDSPDIESLIAEARERHRENNADMSGDPDRAEEPGCLFCGEPWPCPDRLLIDALVSERETLRELLREAIETAHQTGTIRDHSDPNDTTGWNVHGIETCGDLLCVEALAALAGRSVTPDGS